MLRAPALLAFLALGISIPLLTGCPNTCQPSAPLPRITATLTGNTLVVGGSGFTSALPQCAAISVLGLPTPDAIVPEGPVSCTGGVFSNATFSFSFTGCTPNTTVPAVVIGVDQSTLATASQTVSFPWGPGCALAGTCGQNGQPICPGGCAPGLSNQNGRCVPCGTEGQPACSDGSCGPLCPDHSCPGSLNPMTQNGQLVCTSLCGFAQGSYCTPAMANAYGCSNNTLLSPEPACEVDSGGNRIYTCYGGSRLPQPGADNPSCLCYPNTTSNTCQINSSTTGSCQGPGALSGC